MQRGESGLPTHVCLGMGARHDGGEQPPAESCCRPLPSAPRGPGATLITISFVFPSFLLFTSFPLPPSPAPHLISISHSSQQLASPPYTPFPSDYLALQLPEASPLRPKREKRPRLPRKLKVPWLGDIMEGPE